MHGGGGFYPDHPLPYSLERGAPCLKRHLFYGFLFCPGNSRPFFRTARAAVVYAAHTVAVKTKMKNSTLAAKTIFYPLAWPSFTLRPPVQSIPAIIASLSSRCSYIYIYTHTTSCALKVAGAFFFLLTSLLFYFFPLRDP